MNQDDGQIAVKENSLLLLERESGADVTVDISDIIFVKIVKESKFWKEFEFGFFIGGAAGGIAVALAAERAQGEQAAAAFFIFGILGALLGGVITTMAVEDKTIQLEGSSDSEIQAIMEKLRKNARVRNFQ